jgi:hypothetical protein
MCAAVYVPSMVALDVELPISSSELGDVTIHLCLAGTCIEFPAPDHARAGRNPEISGLGLVATARAMLLESTYLNVQLDITRAVELQHDGVEIELLARHARRGELINVRRKIRYDRDSTAACNGDVSRAVLTFTPESKSGLECTGHDCSKHQFELRVRVPNGVNPGNSEVTLCRNSICSSATLRPPSEVTRGITYLGGRLWGAVGVVHESEGFFLDVFDFGSVFELNAGDRYRLVLQSPGDVHSQLLFDRPVEYDTVYPNGPACDGAPCRYACLDLCGALPCVRQRHGP